MLLMVFAAATVNMNIVHDVHEIKIKSNRLLFAKCCLVSYFNFYRAMHFSGLEIACRLSVCNVGDL